MFFGLVLILIDMKQSLCPICSSPKKSTNKYCSYSCRNKARVWTDISRQRLSDSVKKSISVDYTTTDVVCESCGSTSTINVHKKSKPRKYYCSTYCSKVRSRSDEVKSKISKSLKAHFEIKGTVSLTNKQCNYCSKSFVSKKKKQKFCSRSCASTYNMSFAESRERARECMKKTLKQLSIKRRSKNEELFYQLCQDKYKNISNNESIFDGWDADVILYDYKVAVLWNGKWHYEKITKSHSVEQVQNRDRLKINIMKQMGWTPYIIKDMGKHDIKFVNAEFDKFQKWLSSINNNT